MPFKGHKNQCPLKPEICPFMTGNLSLYEPESFPL